ncbi:MAG: hypothetical protein AAF368_10520, partial [Planctomycetota bacterium]
MSSSLFLCALSALTSAPITGPLPQAPVATPLLIRGVTILDATTGTLEPFRSVRIEGGRVAAVDSASALEPEEGDTVLEGRGAILSPGLAEMHGHLPNEAQGFEFAKDVMFLYLSQGITTVRGMLGDEQQLRLRDAVANSEVVGPRL